jgi:hypothetical protein
MFAFHGVCSSGKKGKGRVAGIARGHGNQVLAQAFPRQKTVAAQGVRIDLF